MFSPYEVILKILQNNEASLQAAKSPRALSDVLALLSLFCCTVIEIRPITRSSALDSLQLPSAQSFHYLFFSTQASLVYFSVIIYLLLMAEFGYKERIGL